MERCDRCAIADDSVTLADFCPVCGPTLMCPNCQATHRDEIREQVEW